MADLFVLVKGGLCHPVRKGYKSAMVRLVHLSDPHLFFAGTHLLEVLDRRLIGYLRWRFWRGRKHDEALLKTVQEDLLRLVPDQVLITGDLTHLGLPEEFKKARRWLEKLGPPEKVVVVPGNHDAYRWGPWSETFALWEPYFCGEENWEGEGLAIYFPLVRRINNLVLIGLSTACPNFPPLAIGRLGQVQLERLARILFQTRGLWRILFLHHPPLPGVTSKRKALLDLEPLNQILREAEPELILFGHTHRRYVFSAGKTLVLGASSITSVTPSPLKKAAYFLIEIKGQELSWQERVLVPERRTFLPAREGYLTKG